jgi:hypothetical protein
MARFPQTQTDPPTTALEIRRVEWVLVEGRLDYVRIECWTVCVST